MTEGQNGAADKNECNISESMSNSTSTIIAHDLPIKCGQLFGPFSDPLQWLAFKYTRTVSSEVIERRALELFKNIEIAKHSDEQNLEIVLRNGQFYFKALQNISGHSNCKLMAWFCDDLNVRLPQPSSSTVNGSRRYFCGLCNEVFMYPNLVVIHVLFSCSKRHEIIPSNLAVTTNRSPVSQMPPAKRKKRSFDIASLVNDDKEPSKVKNGFDSPNANSAFLAPTSTIVTSCSSSAVLSEQSRIASTLMSALPQVSPAFANSANHHIPSAFRKVDKTSHLHGNGGDTSVNYDSFAAFYGNSRTMPVTSVFAGTHTGYPSSLSALPSLPSLPSTQQQAMPTPTTSSSSSKPIIPPSLLPFLPPSLAALSFPQTNWCAKCNATFRMTSDLVYHMRSHHKQATSSDPLKKKREEKLRCNICGESFRERHHLTRHMTSHQ